MGGYEQRIEDVEGVSPIDRLEQLQTQWTERYRTVQHRVDELAERTFVGQNADRGVRVAVSGRGEVTEVRIDARRLPTFTNEELATAVTEAEQAARRRHDEAHNAVVQQLLSVDGDGLRRFAAAFAETDGEGNDPADEALTPTGVPEIDGMLDMVRSFRRTSAEFLAELASGTATGTSRDGRVRAHCTASGAISHLQIDQEMMRRQHTMVEHALVHAFRQANSSAQRMREQQVESLIQQGNPLGKLLAGTFQPDDLLAELHWDAPRQQIRTDKEES